MRFSVCLDMMFQYTDFYDRFAECKKSGIETVEFWKWSNKDLSRVEMLLRENDLSFSIFNIDSRNEKLSYDLSRGILNAGRVEEFISALRESIPIYHRLGATGMIVLIGEKNDLPYTVQMQNITRCLLAAKPIVEAEGVTLLLEPLNDIDRKNYFLPRAKEVLELIRVADSKRIKLLFDLYHEQMMGEDPLPTLKNNIDVIGHFHVADVPGRHEPGTGKVDYQRLLTAVRDSRYDGYVGLEYRATRPDGETLQWMKE